jgi:transposase
VVPALSLHADLPLPWLDGEGPLSGDPIAVPELAVHLDHTYRAEWTPPLYRTTSNGLTSGNTIAEATAHALAELCERDALARLRARLHADKAYDVPHLRRWLWGKRIGLRIARKGIDSSERLGRRRWVIERTMSWLTGYRRLAHRYERHPRNYLAFLGLAAALCCYKRFLKLTM